MSGIAIIKEGADFSSKGLGKVTRKGETSQAIKLQSLSIKDMGKIEGDKTLVKFEAEYTPANTQETAVRWVSLEPDILCFTDSLSGAARVVHGDQDASVEVLCISVVDSSILANAIVAVASRIIAVTGLSISGPDSADGTTDTLQYTVSYTPSNTTQTGVEWSSSDEKVATVDANGLVTFIHGTEDKTVFITATSKYDDTLHAGKDITVKAAPQDTFPYFKVGELLDGTEVDVVRGISAYSPRATKYVIGKNAKRMTGVMRAPRADVKHFFDTTNPDPGSPLTTSEIENFNHLPITLGREYIGKTLTLIRDGEFPNVKYAICTYHIDLSSYSTLGTEEVRDTHWQTKTEISLTISESDFASKDHCFVKLAFGSVNDSAFTDDEWTAIKNKFHFTIS